MQIIKTICPQAHKKNSKQIFADYSYTNIWSDLRFEPENRPLPVSRQEVSYLTYLLNNFIVSKSSLSNVFTMISNTSCSCVPVCSSCRHCHEIRRNRRNLLWEWKNIKTFTKTVDIWYSLGNPKSIWRLLDVANVRQANLFPKIIIYFVGIWRSFYTVYLRLLYIEIL